MALSNFFWDSNKPLNSLLIADIPQALRWINFNTQTLLGNEHQTFNTTDNSGGLHKKGSAVVFYDDYSGDPSTQTTRPDGSTTLDGDDVGRLLLDTDGTTLYVWQLKDGETDEWEWARISIARQSSGEAVLRSLYTISDVDYDTDVQVTYQGKIYFGTTAYYAGTASILNNTADGSDTGRLGLSGAGATGTGRGGAIYIYGNNHATLAGQISLQPGCSDHPTDETRSVITVNSANLTGLADPRSDQITDAATKNYVDQNTIGYLYRSAALSLLNAATPIQFDTAHINKNCTMDTDLGKITPLREGYYFVTAQLTIATPSDGSFLMNIYKNDDLVLTRSVQVSDSALITLHVDGIVELNGVDDVIKTVVTIPAGGPETVSVTSPYNTFMSCHWIGAL